MHIYVCEYIYECSFNMDIKETESLMESNLREIKYMGLVRKHFKRVKRILRDVSWTSLTCK